jgi:hypothetical protein
MALHSSVRAKAISSVYFKVNQISVKRFVLCAQVRRFRLAIPFNVRALRIDQLCREPFRHDLLVVRGIRSVQLCICWLGFRANVPNSAQAHQERAKQQHGRFHVSIFYFGVRLSSLMKRHWFVRVAKVFPGLFQAGSTGCHHKCPATTLLSF